MIEEEPFEEITFANLLGFSTQNSMKLIVAGAMEEAMTGVLKIVVALYEQ